MGVKSPAELKSLLIGCENAKITSTHCDKLTDVIFSLI